MVEALEYNNFVFYGCWGTYCRSVSDIEEKCGSEKTCSPEKKCIKPLIIFKDGEIKREEKTYIMNEIE